MIRLEIKNCKITLMKKLQKYQYFHLVNDKYEYLTGVEILRPDQSKIIEPAKFTYSPLEKAFKNK